MTFKAWLIIGAELLLSFIVIYVLLGQVGDANKRADDAEHSLKLAKDTIADMQTRQRDVAALDAKYTGELEDAKATIAQLERDVASGKRRLQVNARCTANGTTSTGSMGDATTPKLTGDAERDYWRLRDGIETITGQVKYLQDYIKSQCVN
jgi:prophage endopeptidase